MDNSPSSRRTAMDPLFCHEHCTHPPLPDQTTIVIEIDLIGKVAPFVSAVTDTSEPQKPDSARIYLCDTYRDARQVFERLSMVNSLRYIETTIERGRKKFSQMFPEEIHTFRSGQLEGAFFYDPRRLFEWLRVEPGGEASYRFPEYVAIREVAMREGADESSADVIVKHEIHLSRDSENRYSVVWFDFRDLYSVWLRQYEEDVDIPRLTAMSESNGQRRFANSFYHTPAPHCTKALSTHAFPTLLLLDILGLDLSIAEVWPLGQRKLWPVQSLRNMGMLTIDLLINERLATFAARKLLIAKIEGIQTYAAYLKDYSLPSLHDPIIQSSFGAMVQEATITTSFLLSEIRRHDNQNEELLALHTRVAQGRQASSMSALTYCAALFLPLSLAASFLSMQNRTRDMGMKTYDFLGVATVFATVAAMAFVWQRRFSRGLLFLRTDKQYESIRKLNWVKKSRFTGFECYVAWVGY
jgi:hypothetical protein